MSKDMNDEDIRDLQEERQAFPEAEEPQEEDPKHPGWVTIARVFNSSDPFFEKILFLYVRYSRQYYFP